MNDNATRARLTELDQFGLDEAAFRRLRDRNVWGYAYLRTYDVTSAVQRLPRLKRQPYIAARVDRWIKNIQSHYPDLSFRIKGAKPSGATSRRWSQLPTTLGVRGTARRILELASEAGVRLIYVTKIAGHRRLRLPKAQLEWHCVRALVVIQVERAESGLQTTEDRFMLVRASSFADAKKRLRKLWREYATPYLNSEGRMVRWRLDRIVDVSQTSETEIDPCGTEVYSKLGQRRMRPNYVWRPRIRR